jgi:hypothetical protein
MKRHTGYSLGTTHPANKIAVQPCLIIVADVPPGVVPWDLDKVGPGRYNERN